MTATAAMRAQLRRMVDEPTTTTYTDDTLNGIIETYPLTDERGVDPYWYDTSQDPPQQVATEGWIPGYDLHAAAAQIWEEKASAVAENFAYPTIEGTFDHARQFDSYSRKARYHRSRRSMRTAKAIPSPSRYRRGNSYVGNLPEDI